MTFTTRHPRRSAYEAVRVARAGFPVRLPHLQFVSKFRSLGVKMADGRGILAAWRRDTSSAVRGLLAEVAPKLGINSSGSLFASSDQLAASVCESVGIRVGRTKVFLRKRAFETLESLLSHTLANSATAVGAAVRGWLARRRFRLLQRGVLRLQLRLRMLIKRRVRSATKLAAFARQCAAMRLVRAILDARKKGDRMRFGAAVLLQSCVRRKAAQLDTARKRGALKDVRALQSERERLLLMIDQLRTDLRTAQTTTEPDDRLDVDDTAKSSELEIIDELRRELAALRSSQTGGAVKVEGVLVPEAKKIESGRSELYTIPVHRNQATPAGDPASHRTTPATPVAAMVDEEHSPPAVQFAENPDDAPVCGCVQN
jgi:myosin-5